MNNTATRLITLIFLLQNQPNQKASELAHKLGVSLRTIHRYFEMLDEMGIPVCSERGPYGGFSLVRGYKMPPLVFTLEEAVAIALGTSMVKELWGELYREASQGALAKLENLLPDEQCREVTWAHQSLVATRLHRADVTTLTPTLEKLRQATHERHQISTIYQSLKDEKGIKRKIDPYALVFQAGWWYMVGYCHLRAALRTFRVDRFKKLTILDTSFQTTEEFNIHKYLEDEFHNQPVIRARLRFIPQAAHIVTNNSLAWELIQQNPDGSVDATLTAPDLPWLASTALSLGNWVTVLEPQELRDMVLEWAQATANLYQIPPGSNKPISIGE